jgi:hypothetical protein
MKWLKHAFAVDESGPAEPTPEQEPAIDWFCRQIAKRHLTTPGLIGLEMSRPLNFIASQTMHFFGPGVWAIVKQQTYEHYEQFAAFLEKRGSIDYLCQRIEHFEMEAERQKASGMRHEAQGKIIDDP